MKKFIGLLAAGVVALLVLAPTTFAADFVAPDKDTGNVTLSRGDVHHNTYVAGGSVFVNSDITGDLYAAGGTVTVEGSVEQDVVIAGGTVTINGPVGGDIRVAGGTVTINGPVTGDVLIAGGSVHLTEKASVGGDLAAAGGDLTLEAPVVGNVNIGSGTVTLNSKISGKVVVRASQALTIGSKALVEQPINYKGVKPATVADGAEVASIDYEMIPAPRGGSAGKTIATIFTIAFVIKVIGLVLFGLLIMKLFPRTTHNVVSKIHDRPWVNLGIGVLFFIVTPILSIIVLFTLVGVYFTMVAMMAFVIMIILSVVASSIFVGSWIIRQLNKKPEIVVDWQALLIGTVIVGIVAIIPFLGTLALFIILSMSFGAMLRMLSGYIKSQKVQ